MNSQSPNILADDPLIQDYDEKKMEDVYDFSIDPFVKAEHYDVVKSWWSLYYGGDIFPEKCVPDNGVVVCHAGKPVASCFIYANESKFCHIGFSMVDPAHKAGKRIFFLRKCIEATLERAKELVGEDAVIWSLTDHAVVARVYREKGIHCLGEGDLFAYAKNTDDLEFLT
jgi:hypothetical protein